MIQVNRLAGLLSGIFNRKHLNNEMRQWLYDLLGFRAQLGSIADAMPSMIEAQKKIGSRAEKKWRVLEDINDQGIRSGEGVSAALKPFVPEDEYNLLSACESSANLAEGFAKASNRLEQKIAHKKSISGVRNQILMRCLMLVGIVWFLGEALFTPLARISKPETWHPIAKTTYFISSTVHIWLPVLVLLIAAVWMLVVWSTKHWKNSKYRTFAMNNLQPWGIHRDMTAMTTLESFVALSATRSEKATLMALLHATNSEWLKECIRMMMARIKDGRGNILVNNPLIPQDLNDVLISMGDGAGKEVFYTVSITRLNSRIDKKMKVMEERISTIGTLAVYSALTPMIMSYFLVSLSAAKF